MDIFKKIIFVITIPIVVPISVFLAATYDWWTELSKTNRILFFALMPIYGPLSLFDFWVFDAWSRLAG